MQINIYKDKMLGARLFGAPVLYSAQPIPLEDVPLEVAGYGSSTKEVSATRSYPNLASQDTANIPKTIQDGGRTLTLQNISWQTDNTASTAKGGTVWSESVIRGILKNEKYCGDVLMQKTYTQDCISKKQIRNVGQLPMYLVQNNHEGIVTREKFYEVQAEFARRNAGRAPSQKLAPTGRSCYSAKYALTERLVCGECGTLYRRCVWVKRGQKFAVWRCASRIDYGKKYCHSSPTLREKPLQAAILTAINAAMSQREVLVGQIEDAMRMELIPFPGSMSVSDIERRLDELDREFQTLFADSKDGGFMKHAEDFKRISSDMATLKEQKAKLLDQQNSDSAASRRIANAMDILNAGSAYIEWDESIVRQLVDTVKVLSADRIMVCLQGGIEIEQMIEKEC